LIKDLGCDRVIMGFPGAGGTHEGHVIHYIDSSGPNRKRFKITIGEIDGSLTIRLEKIKEMFEKAGIPVEINKNIDAWLKMHVALVSPIANAIYMAGNDNYRLARTQGGLVMMIRAIREGMRVLEELNFPIMPKKLKIFKWIPEPILVAFLRKKFNAKQIEMATTKHALAARDEMKEIADEFKELARKTSIPTPAIDNLYKYIDPDVPPIKDGSSEIPLKW